jgi:hypothetical protein
MGLLKFFARVGAVGGTARIIGKQYLHIKNLHKNDDLIKDAVIYRLIIMDRYKILKNNRYENILMEKASSIKGLKQLVAEILILEAGFAENDYKTQALFNEVIEEELLNKGVSKIDV